MKNMKRIAIGFAVALVSALAQAGIDGATTACTPGTWTTSIDNARKVGKANKRFIAIAWGKSTGCGFCNAAASSVFNKSDFKKWSKDNGIPILWVDDLDAGSCSEWIWNKYYGGGAVTFAQFLVIDPSASDKLLLKALFQGATVQYGTKSKTGASTTGCPNAWLLSPFDPDQTVGMIDWTLGQMNNTADSAVAVSPDAKGAAQLTVNRLWNTYGKRSLSCQNLWSSSSALPKIKLITHAEDQFDWFKFTASAAGAYQVNLQDYVDSHNEGQLYVFRDAATAKQVTTYALAAEKAMASCPMQTISANDGWKFAVPSAGTYYILFTRPDSEKCKQTASDGKTQYDGYVEKTLTYNFTLQETDNVDSGDYWFDGWLALSGAEGTTNELTVTRSETKAKGSVNIVLCSKDEMTDIPLAKPGDYIAAVKGAPGVGDFYLIDGSGNVLSEVASNTYACSFAAGAATGKIRFVFNRGTEGIQRRDRAFGIRLDVETEESGTHYHETFATIEDADKSVNETEGALNATETAQSNEHDKFGLIGDETSHVYFFTNVARTAGSVYGFFVQAGGANDFANGRLKIEVIRTSTGERLVPVASNLYDAETSTLAAGDTSAYATYIYGTDSVNGFGPDNVTTDVVVRVSRAAGAAGEFPDVRYWLQWQRFERPVVSFDGSGVSYATEERPASVTADVTVDSLAAIKSFHAPFALDVAWKTANPKSGNAATDGVDYTAVSDGHATFAADTGSLTVNLLEQKTLSYPTRSFTLALQGDPNKIYTVDTKASAYTVTLEEDNVKAAGAATIAISGTEWQTSGEEIRNLNYKNTNDWITVTGVKNGNAYRLKALDVLSRPVGEETNVTVAVYTNGAPSAYAYRLSELILTDDAQAPILMFTGLKDGTVQLKVSRPAKEQIRLEYRLAMREEENAGLDKADPRDDTRSGAAAIAIAADGTETNLVRLLNGSTDAYYGVNDTNDWFRFTGIRLGETYYFAVKDITTNTAVRAAFYRGSGTTPLKDMSLGELASGFRYDAPSADDVYVRVYRTAAAKYALVKYTLGASRYVYPEVGFTTAAVTVTNTLMDGTVALGVYRRVSTSKPVTAKFSAASIASSEWANDTYLAGVAPESLTFATVATNSVALAIRKPQGAWVGDWTFNVALNVDTKWCRYGAITNVLVTVVDQAMPAKDPTDGPNGDDVKAHAATLNCATASVTATNHLNGIDVKHAGVLSTDTTDWFKLTGLKAEKTYRLSIPASAFIVNNADGLGLTVTVESETFTKTVTCASLAGGQYLDIPSPTGRDVYVKVARTTSTEEKPISVAYALKVETIAWPKFDLKAEKATVRNDAGVARATVTRSLDTARADTVVVKVVDANEIAVTRTPRTFDVAFKTNETVKTVEVGLVAATNGFWKRGGDFAFVLERASSDPYVSLGATNATVKVTDASGVPENDYAADDEQEGAQEYCPDVATKTATGHLAKGQSVAWLNGDDLVDWYCLTNAQAECRYRIGITSFGTANAEDCPPQIAIYDEAEYRPIRAEIGEDGCFEWDYTPSVDGDIWIKIWREADETKDVSVKYLLTYSQLSPAYVKFAATAQTVSGAAAAVYADVVCTVENGEELFEDVSVTVWPQEDAGAAASAKAGVGFDAEPVTVTWSAGSTGGVQRIAVPIAGSSETWKGQETFLLVLSNETDTAEIAAPENGGQQRVTVEDVATPAYGTVGVTKAGASAETLSKVTSSSVLSTREGDAVVVRVTRVNGQAGAVTGVWTWKNGSTTVGTAVKRQLFAGVTVNESTTADVVLTVPVTAGYQAKRTLTLNFAIETAKAKTVTITKGTPTALKFSVVDKDYADVLSAYSANDRAKLGFKASGASWFLDCSGGVRAAVKANATQTMTASVTGPGTLTFDATVAGGCKLAVKVNGSEIKTLSATSPDETVRINVNGTATVSFLCVSPKTLASDSACAVSNVRFARDDAANKYGTFNGKALVDGKPGLATLTVSSAGKISGKIICADRTWTFTATGGWTAANSFTATLKSGAEKLEGVTFQLRLATGEVAAAGEDVEALFARNGWGDKPLSDEAATAYARCVGYFTTVLKAETDAVGAPLYGSGYCGLTVSKSGVVKAAGKLADGQTLSVSAVLVPADDDDDEGILAKTFLFAKPSAYKGGWYFASPAFRLRDFGACGEKVVVTNAVLDAVLEHATPWTSSANAWSMFERNPGFVGGWYDKTENLHDHYLAGLAVADIDEVSDQAIAGTSVQAKAWAGDEEHPVSLAFAANGSRLTATCGGGNLFTVSMARATGLFSGSFRATYDYAYGGRTRTTTKSFAYQGMLIPYAPEGETAAGRGYFLMPEKNGAGKTVNRSYEIEIGEAE